MIQRTFGIVIASGLLASASLADISGGTMEGGAYLQAGEMFGDHIFGVPASETFSLSAPQDSANTVVRVITTATATALTFDFDISTTGTGDNLGGADVFLEFTLVETTNFLLTGNLSGLTLFQSTVMGNDNDTLVFDEVFYDTVGGYFGTLVDGQGQPIDQFVRQGVLEAGSYVFALTSYSEALPGAGGFDGTGHLSLALTIPAPAAAFALAAPGLMLARRRRG